MSLIQRNSDRLMNARSSYDQSLVISQKPEQMAFAGQYSSGKYQVKTLQGNTYYALSNTTGAIGRGDKVSLSLSRGGIPYVDAMPR